LVPENLVGNVATIIDIGAYIGISTLYFAARYPQAKILAVEPDPNNYACLKQNLRSITDPDRVQTVEACIANKRGTVFFANRGPHWARSINSCGGVRVASLDIRDVLDMCGFQNPDLLKMDIEGGEQYAFASSGEWLDQVRWILMEVHFSAMSLSNLAEKLHHAGRPIILHRSGPPRGRWTRLSAASCTHIEATTACLDVLIPPPGFSMV